MLFNYNMNTQEIIIIVLLLVVLYMCKKATYNTGGGGLMPRPMPKVEYINGPYVCADVRNGIEFVVTA